MSSGIRRAHMITRTDSTSIDHGLGDFHVARIGGIVCVSASRFQPICRRIPER
jgi:hypothetical protein